MITVRVGNGLQNVTKVVSNTATPRQVFEEAGINYARGITSIDTDIVRAGDLDRTFEELGVTGECVLYSVVKAEGAR